MAHSHRHESETAAPWRARSVPDLLSGSCLESGLKLSRHPSAVFHLDALRLGPLPDLSRVQRAYRRPASSPGRPPATAACPPGGAHVARQRASQLLGMPGAQIDLVLRAVQPEADGAVCLTAIKVIDQLDLYLLSHNCLFLSRAWRISLANPSRWAQPLQADPALPCRAGRWAAITSLTSARLRSQRAAATCAPRDGPVVTVRKWHPGGRATQARLPHRTG